MDSEIKNSLAIVIDVLRASNTIITALNNGAQKILPVTEINLAWEIKTKHPEFLLGGERNSKKITGFDFGNSPLEYSKSKVYNKTIILTTSNGSNALKKVEKAENIYVASLANSTAVAQKLNTLHQDIVIVCSGTLGTPSLEDTIAAGKIIKNIENLDTYILNDFAYIALSCFDYYQGKLLNTILHSRNGQRLQKLGLLEDIKYCALENTIEIIPQYSQNKIYL